ncbi:EF-hand domain-containing protein [Limibaculum sp. FT325]|uniref:EF-hand domain-containing protein n=1 Tax=Thermohalobaculum sediminis TaxID=2939436 RepID=UPI0020C00F53|nr:EF-hand domain-containing protein [Limibaculum sediminis]MCL5777554.1 EF-hand domain-containing protein [Limibaculum sediminis]
MMVKRIAALAAGIGAIAGVALAASFGDIDTDADGMITQEEFAAAFPDAGAEIWTATDVNADGVVTEDELAAAVESGVLPEG